MDPVWGCTWCTDGEGTCDCTTPCGAEQCEIDDFYEDDEPIEDIKVIWDRSVKGVTAHNDE